MTKREERRKRLKSLRDQHLEKVRSKSDLLAYFQRERPTMAGIRRAVEHFISPQRIRIMQASGNFGKAVFEYLGGQKTNCLRCAKPTRFIRLNEGYAKYCSQLCARLNAGGGVVGAQPHRKPSLELEKIFVRRLPEMDGRTLRSKLRTSRYWSSVIRNVKRTGASNAEVIYHMFVNQKIGRCIECNEPTRLHSITKGYGKFCCSDCGGRYGKREWSKNPIKVNNFLERRRKTSMREHGVNHHWLLPQYRSKARSNSSRIKTMLYAGNTYRYRGYENFAIKRLVDMGYEVINDYDRLPIIPYEFRGKTHEYEPDIMIGNTIFEVKSAWSAGLKEKLATNFSKLVAKADGVRRAGYRFIMLLYDHKGRLLIKSDLIMVEGAHWWFKEEARAHR